MNWVAGNVDTRFKVIVCIVFILGLTACGGGGGGGGKQDKLDTDEPISVGGGGVKGPLANADVTAYAFDPTQTDFKGSIIDTGTTDASSAITGLSLPVPLDPPYILEFKSNPGTTDITTDQAPVIPTLRTVLTQQLLDNGDQIYATPLTTMAVDIAVANADSNVAPYTGDSNGTVTEQEFLDALAIAAGQVVSTFGFGASTAVDIFDTPPLIDDTTVSTVEQNAVAEYRTAVEALSALMFELGTNSAVPAQTAEAMFAEFTADLSDGVIDGQVNGTTSAIINGTVLSDLTSIDPATLVIPNSTRTVGDVKDILVDEKSKTGSGTPTPELEPGGSIVVTPQPAVANPSQDGDTIPDSVDNCPSIANEDQSDTNGNGVGDLCDNAPVAMADSITADEGGTVSVLDSGAASVLQNDTDAEGDALTAMLVTDVVNGDLSLATDGTFSYIHNGSETISDSFTYYANDGTSDSNTITVSIAINSVDDPAVLTADNNSITENTARSVSGNVLDNDVDPDTALTVTNAAGLNGTGTYGTLSIDGTGAYSYALDNANAAVNALNIGDTLTETYTYNAGGQSATLTVTINGADDSTVTNPDTVSITEDAVPGFVSGNVLTNDSDPDTALTVSNAALLDGTGVYGILTIDDTGAFTYQLDNGNTAVNALNDGDTLTESYTYNVNGGPSETLTITIEGNTDGGGGTVNVGGVWEISTTVTSDNPPGCRGVNDIGRTIITIEQNGNVLSMRDIDGATLGGTIDTVSGDFVLSGSKSFTYADLSLPTDVNAFINETNTIDASGTGVTGTSLSGSVTTVVDDNGDVCTFTENFTGNFIYDHDGTEDYNGVYAFELAGEDDRSDGPPEQFREAFPFEVEVTGSSIAFHLPDEGPAGVNDTYTFSNEFFDPNTGFFSFEFDEVERNDFDNPPDGTIEESTTDHLVVTGIFLRDPAVTNGSDGAPLVEWRNYSIGRSFTGDVLSGGTPYAATNGQEAAYGKRLVTQGLTRTALIEKGDQTDETIILVGLQNPPLKRVDMDNSALYIEVLDESGMILCSTPYIYDGAADGRYFQQSNEPDPDFFAQNFRSNNYSSVNCNTADGRPGVPVTDGEVLTVRVLDIGPDGIKDTSSELVSGDDSLVTIPVLGTDSISYSAEVVPNAERFIQTPKAFDIDVNGVTLSTTLSGAEIPLFGYIDKNDAINVSWPALPGATAYQVRIQGLGVDDYIKYRYRTSATNYTIPANNIDYDEFTLRLMGNKSASNTAIGMSFSRRLNIKNGVNGSFNVELGNGLPLDHRTFQVYIEADEFGGFCTVTSPTSSIWPISCAASNSAFVDFTTDTVTLTMVDDSGGYTGTPGANFNLLLHFTDARRAEVTSPDGLPGVPAAPGANTTAAKVANPEFYLRTRLLSHNGIQRTHLNVTNSFPGLFTRGVLSREDGGVFGDASTTSVVLWDENQGKPFSDVAAEFTTVPTNDGNAQSTKMMASLSTNAMGFGNVVLATGVYKLVLIDQTGNTPNAVLRYNYTAPSAANYIAPNVQSIVIDGTDCSVSTCNAPASPISVSSTPSLSWAIDSNVPTGSYWRIHFRPTDSTGDATSETLGQVRTPFMQNGDFGLDIGGSAATWTNPGDLVLPSGTYEVQIYVYDGQSGATSTVFGSSTGSGGIGGDQVYITVP